MVTVIFENAVCRRSSKKKEKYRLALSNGGSEVRSEYHDGRNVFEWERPFQQPVEITTSSPPIRLTIELRSKGFLGFAGHKVSSYTLNLLRDCQYTTFDLQNTESDVQSLPRLSVTVTVAGLSASGTESLPQLSENLTDIHPPVGAGTSEPDRSVPLNQNPVNADPTSHPDAIEFPTPHALPSSSSPTNPPVPVLRFSTPDDPERETSSSPDGLQKRAPDQYPGLPNSAPRPPRPAASHIDSSQLLSAESAARNAKNEQSTIRQRSDSNTDSISTVEPVASAAGGLGDAMFTGVARLDAVVQIINVAADIHPLVKGVWSLLNTAYTLAKQEHDLDAKIEDLVHALDANCDFAKELAANDLTETAASIVGKILGEVQNGARLIEEYCTVRKSRASMFKFAASTTSIRVDACLQTLEAFQRHLNRYITAGVQHDLQSLSSKLSSEMELLNAKIDQMNQDARIKELLAEMPFAPEADRAMRNDDRGCLPGTRGEIIDALVQWATGNGVDASQSYIGGLDPDSRVVWHTSISLVSKYTSCGGVETFDDAVVIDAFDESGTVSARAAALLALSPDAPTTTFPTSLRFIITSRYDFDIAERLESAMKNNPSLISLLHMEDVHPPDTERDIKIYVTHMLGSTRGLEASRAAGDLARLAVTAQHSFQWASSASRYIVDADDHDGARLPAERLQETLATRGGLDKLYISILDRFFGASILRESEGTRSLRMILGCLVCASEPLSVQTIAALASADPSFSTADKTSFHILARKLSSIITGTKDTTTPLVAFHTSFTDFLSDKKRSESYAVSAPDTHLHLALASLAVMKKLLRFNICHLESSFLRNNQVVDLPERLERYISSELSYACRLWPVHVAAALSSASPDVKALQDSFSAFLESKPLLLQWLEVMSLTGTNAYNSLSPLLSLQAGNRDLSDLITFTTYFSIPIGTSVPHIYLSALAFAPTSSLIIAPVSTHFPDLVHPSPPLRSWPQVRHSLMHQSQVNCVAFSPNGRWVVSGADSGEISVWDVYSGNRILPRMSVSGAIKSIAISRDGSLLASGSDDGIIQLWDMRTLSSVGKPVKAHTNWVWSVTFSPNGMRLASCSSDNTIRLWDLQSGSAVQRASATHNKYILSVAFSPDGKLLASGSEDGTVRLWDVPTLSPNGESLRGHTSWVQSIVFSSDGALLVSGSYDKTIRFWDVQARSAIGNPLAAHNAYIHSVVFSPDGQTLASCSGDKTVRLWDVESCSSSGEPLTGHTGKVLSIAFSPDGALLASGSSDKTVHVWDARVPALIRESPATQFKIQYFVAFSRDGKILASGSDNYAIQLWNVHSVSAVGEPLSGHTNDIRSVAFSPDGTLLASGSDDETVRLWDVRTCSAVGEPLRGHSNSVWALAFSPDSKLLASGSDDSTIRFWDTHARSASGNPLTGHSRFVMSIAFSRDGFTLASGDACGTVRLWDVQTRSLIGRALQGHSAWVRCVAFSSDGTLLASGSSDNTVRLWSVRAQSAIGEPLIGHINPVTSLAFSPDGALLVSSSEGEGVVRVWDVRLPSDVGASIAMLRHESAVYCIAIFPASTILSSITGGGVVRRWDLGSLLSPRTATVNNRPKNRLEKPSSLLLPDHPDLSGLPPDFLEILHDGWVVGPNQELVLWIPPAVRPSLSNLLEVERFGGPPPTFLDFIDFVCGSDWAKCYSPPPPPSHL